MQCELCHVEIEKDSKTCPSCGAPQPQNVDGFPCTMDIQGILRQLVIEHFQGATINVRTLTAVLKDALPDYRRECRLLIYAVECGVMQQMLSESDRDIAVQRARVYLVQDCFISAKAAEFVLACLTYMLKWPFNPVKGSEIVQESPAAVQDTAKDAKKSRPVSVDEKVFKRIDALRFRISKKIEIPAGTTKVGGFALDGYTFLQSVLFPDSLLAIDEYAFSGCKALKYVEIPASLRIIGQGAFSQCSSLMTLTIPHGVLEIADSTFMCCEALETIVIPPTVSSIGGQAFSGCEKLKKIVMPQSIKFIGDEAFLNCPKLVIRCYENSYAHKYALANNIKFEALPVGTDLA